MVPQLTRPIHWLPTAGLSLALACFATGCGGSNTPPSSSDPSGGETIRGTERIGWDQQAANQAELASFRFAIYVDGTRTELRDASCTGSAGSAGFPCSARLPSMSPGTHTLELATFTVRDGAVSESARSAPLRVTVSPGSTAPPGSSSGPGSSSDKSRASGPFQTIVEGLGDAVDLAFAPDGRLFVATADGRIRIIRDGVLEVAPALDLNDAAMPRRVMAVALHPDFARTHLVYLLHTTAGEDGRSVFRLSRYREVGEVLGERAVLLDAIPASTRPGAGTIRFGPDRHLYVALDDGDDQQRAGSAASYNGKILRLKDDGTAPTDQSGAPVHATGFASPCGLDWDRNGLLWVADCRGGDEGRLVAVSSKDSGGRAGYRRAVTATLSGAVFYSNNRIASLANTFLLGSPAGLLKVRFSGNPSRVAAVEHLFGDTRAIRALAVAPDGAVVAALDDQIVRIATGDETGR